MTDSRTHKRWHPSKTSLIAGGFVLAGFLLSGISWWFFLLVAAGLFGPGLLREMGWLTDKDEFQRRADYRAGYHAFLVTGIAATVLVAFFRSGDRTMDDPQELATLLLTLLSFTWIFSSLLAYWGVRKTAARILYGFGSAWLIFMIASNSGPEWTGWTALLMQSLLTLPFFVLAWFSGRWPRIAGILLIAFALYFVWFFGMFRRDNLSLINQTITFILFLGPLFASGIALLASGQTSEKGEEE